MPMPAPKSIAAQLTVENSGFSPSSPRGILPYFEKAKMMSKNIRNVARAVKIQPKLRITQSSAVEEASKTCSGAITPQITKATTSPPTTKRIGLSTPYLTFWSSMETPGTSAGWILCGYIMSFKMRLALRVRFLLSSELFTPRTGRDEEDDEEEMVLLLFCFPGFTFKRAVYTLIKTRRI